MDEEWKQLIQDGKKLDRKIAKLEKDVESFLEVQQELADASKIFISGSILREALGVPKDRFSLKEICDIKGVSPIGVKGIKITVTRCLKYSTLVIKQYIPISQSERNREGSEDKWDLRN